jgi:hypothetical protein
MTGLLPRFTGLADWLADQTGADALTIDSITKMAGGAIQENWHLEVTISGGRLDGAGALVLRTDAPS